MSFATKMAVLLLVNLVLTACEQSLPGTGSGQIDVSGTVIVGLLVPAGSENPQTEQLALSLIKAARLAQSDISGAEIDLRIYETSGTEAGAQVAATAAIADGAEILVGPLFSAEAAAVRPLAAAEGVPVISFSNNAAVAGGGVYVLGVTYASVANRLVAFAGGRGLRGVAVVHPAGIDGESGRDAVRTAVTAAGATFAGAHAYSLNVDGIVAAGGQIARQVRAKGANVIIFTDTPTGGLGFITASLRAAGLGESAYQFIGLTRWDSSAEALAQPSLAGGWFALPDPLLSAQFDTRYRTAYAEEPHELSGIAYDAIAAVGAMLHDARLRGNNQPFSPARITDPAGFAGVNGIFRFLPDGTNERGLAVMQVSAGAATMVDPAIRSFGGPES